MLWSWIITHPTCPSIDFLAFPWNEAVLVTPCHAIWHHWNIAMCCGHIKQAKQQLFIHPANDTIQDHSLMLKQHFAKQTKHWDRQEEQACLPDNLILSVGMKVVVTFNVETHLNIANGSHGKIKAEAFSNTDSIVTFTYPPILILIKMESLILHCQHLEE